MGQNEYGLKSLADDQLISGLANIVHRRNQITAEFLAYLAELDERRLFLDLGFSSLFEYCVETLRLCESTAGRHIAAARVCRNYPESFALVASGTLHASALSLLKKHLTPENATELFELCAHQSARKVEELLAARFPRPDVRDLVRRLPARAGVVLDVEYAIDPARITTTSREVCVELASTASPLGETSVELSPTATTSSEPAVELAKTPAGLPPRELTAAASGQAAKQRRLEPLSADRYGVHFTADGEFCALLDRVRGLAGHRLPSGDLMTLLKRGLEAYERELEKERFAVGGKTRRKRHAVRTSDALCTADASKSKFSKSELSESNPQPKPNTSPTPKPKPHYPTAVVRAVFLRDGKRCSYVSPDGRRCSARRCLELDHIEPRAAGGEDTIYNLRLRCRAHNQWYARQYFGTSRVDAAIKDARLRRAAETHAGEPHAAETHALE